VGAAGWVANEIAGDDVEGLAVADHAPGALEDKIELLLGVRVGVGTDAGAGRQLGEVDEVAAAEERAAVGDPDEPDQTFAAMGLNLLQQEPTQVAGLL